MRKGLAIVIAYLATVALVPLLFGLATRLWSIPIPRGLLFTPVLQAYGITAFLALIAALPGFAVSRFLLSWRGAHSLLAFVLAGALVGALAAVLLCLPDRLFALSRYNILVPAAVIGALAGMIYHQIETLLTQSRPFLTKPVKSGENGR